ncbi:MAG: plastocyanin/azurin family copper-binding protein [Acidimicrobiia bacterium]
MIRFRPLVGFAAGVLLLAACGGGGDGGGQSYKEPTGPAQDTLKIEAGNFYFKPDKPTAKSEVVELELDGVEGLHTLVFDNGKVPGFQMEVSSGQTSSKKIDLKPGKYTFYCDIPGHRAQGMEGTLTIT